MKFIRTPFFLIVLLFNGCGTPSARRAFARQERVVAAYWQNWDAEDAPYLEPDETTREVNRLLIAFAIPRFPGTGNMEFKPLRGTPDEFKVRLENLRKRGVRVLISVGGANHPVELRSPRQRDQFVRSMREIIDTYGFDGLDIDLEGPSVVLDEGDTDFRAPTTSKIVHFIEAMRELKAHYGPDFLLTAAPETQFTTGGYGNYGVAFGGYLPILHALRDDLDLVHMQYYNSGSQFLYTGDPDPEKDVIAEPATAEFVVGLSEMLILGFPVARNPDQWFEGLGAQKVAVGLPATPEAAGSGYLPPEEVRTALRWLMTGEAPADAAYTLRQPEGHPTLRGLMTWSLNLDAPGKEGHPPHAFVRNAHELLTEWATSPAP